MNKTLTIYIILGLICFINCTSISSSNNVTDQYISITCSPKFIYHTEKDIDLTMLDDDHLIPFRQWLVLDDGKSRFKLKWPTRGLSPGSLMTSNVYTFILRKDGENYIIEKPITRHE